MRTSQPKESKQTIFLSHYIGNVVWHGNVYRKARHKDPEFYGLKPVSQYGRRQTSYEDTQELQTDIFAFL